MMGEEYWQRLVTQIIGTIVFTCIGLAFFMLSDWIVERVMPRSIRRAIEEEKNVALAIVIASVILGIAIIVGAAVHS
jgi:putative membrane protein